MVCFGREKLYGMPRVTISSFGSEIDREKTTVYEISIAFTEFQSDTQRESYDDFTKVTSLR